MRHVFESRAVSVWVSEDATADNPIKVEVRAGDDTLTLYLSPIDAQHAGGAIEWASEQWRDFLERGRKPPEVRFPDMCVPRKVKPPEDSN